MNNKISVDFTDAQIERAFSELRINKQRQSFNQGIKKSGAILVKEYKSQIKKEIKSEKYTDLFKGIDAKSFRKGVGLTIRITKVKDQKNKGWLLPTFELGSKPRYHKRFKKKKRFTGSVRAYGLFDRSKKLKESEVINSMTFNIKQAIINNWIKQKK